MRSGEPSPPAERVPLSAAQHWQWRLHQLDPDRPGARVVRALRLRGPVDLGAFTAAVEACTARHEALRVSIEVADGRPYRCVDPGARIPVPVHDLTEAEFTEGVHALAEVPFDLACAPLVRIHLFRFGALDHGVVLVAHEVVADGAALDLLAADLLRDYGALVSGRNPAPPALRPRQVDPGDPGITGYWVERLRGMALLDLPLDRPRTAAARRGARLPFAVPADLTADLDALARAERIPLATVLQAAFAELLHHLTGQREVVFAVPVSGRTQPGSRAVVGRFGTEAVLRVAVTPASGPAALRRAVWQTALAAHAHQEVPWYEVLARSGSDRLVGRNPVFDVLFAVRPAAAELPDLSGVSARRVPVDPGTAALDLTVEIHRSGEGLTGYWEYRTDLFDGGTVRAWLQTFLRLLAMQQDRSVAELAERRRRRMPGAPAVITDRCVLSFEDVGRQADRTAAALRARGAGPERLVAIRLVRTEALSGAVLGVLRSGAAVLAIGAGPADDRIADAWAADDRVADAVCAVLNQPVLAGLDTTPPRGTSADEPPADLDALAAVVPVPAAAGRPALVELTQWALVHRLLARAALLGVGPADRVLHPASPTGAPHLEELLLPLVTGAAQVITEPGTDTDPERLVDLIRTHRVTVLAAHPAVLRLLVARPAFAECPGLRLICCCGELPDVALAERLSVLAPVYTLYGRPETTMDVLVCRYVPGAGQVRLGEPYPGSTVAVLDDRHQPVPPGCIGELSVGGMALARGYRGEPGRTAQRFGPDPAVPGGRRFLTGDLGRRHPDGTLEYLGNRDLPDPLAATPLEHASGRAARRGPAQPAAGSPAPLSRAQRRIWRFDRENPGSSAHTLARAAWLTGPVSVPLLRSVCADLVTRHETLRTVVRRGAAGDLEALASAPNDVLTVVEGAEVPDAEAEAGRLLRHWALRPFAAGTGQLLRVVLVRLGGERYGMGLAVQRLACDPPSLRLLLDDLTAAYADPRGWALRPGPERTYADFARAEQARPAAPPEPAGVRTGGVVRDAQRRLDERCTAQLVACARQDGSTLRAVLLDAVRLTLDGCGRPDAVVATTVDGRPRRHFDGVVGCFVDVRSDAALPWDVLFDYSDAEPGQIGLPGVRATPIALPEPDPWAPLVVHAHRDESGIALRIVASGGPRPADLLDRLVRLLTAHPLRLGRSR